MYCTISRNGDLVHKMYLEIDGTPGDDKANVNATSITDVEIQIGGQQIDKQTGQFMNVWSELTEPNELGHVGQVDGKSTEGTRFQNMACRWCFHRLNYRYENICSIEFLVLQKPRSCSSIDCSSIS